MGVAAVGRRGTRGASVAHEPRDRSARATRLRAALHGTEGAKPDHRPGGPSHSSQTYDVTRIFDTEADRWVSVYRPASSGGPRFAIFQEAIRRRLERRRALALQLLDPRPGMAVLDVGCGHGSYARAILAEGARWIGVDVSIEMLRRGKGSPGDPAGRAVWLNGEAYALPIPSAAFDAVLCIGVLNYHRLDVVARILGELGRVLRPGGTAVVSSLRLDPITWARSRLYPAVPVPVGVPGPLFPHQTDRIAGLLGGKNVSIVDSLDVRKYGFQPHYTLLKLVRHAAEA